MNKTANDAMSAPEAAGQGAGTALPGWNRVALIFGALCLIKLVMLWNFRKHLFEEHWRVANATFTWVNHVAFYAFAPLAGLNLWKLAGRCAAGGARVVRYANGCVLALSAIFIFLTFHEADKSYVYALIDGSLGWRLGWNLYTNACFRSPYLALWIFGYAAAYYVLARTKREHLMLRVTAVCATAYIALCLSDLMVYREALVVIDCVGIASLFASRRTISLSLVWLGLLAGAVVYLFFLFSEFSPRLSLAHLIPEFGVVLWGNLIVFAVASMVAWRRGFFAAWGPLLPFALTASLLLSNTNYPTAGNYENLLFTGLMMPRYFLGELILAAVLLGLAIGYRKWRPKASLWWLDAAGLVLIILSLVDLRLSQIMGVRLDWDVLSLAFGETPKMMWRMARPYLPALAAVIVGIIAVYAALLYAIRRAGGKNAGAPVGPVLADAKFIVIGFVLLALAGNRLLDPDKAQGQTVARLVETSPVMRHASQPLMNEAGFMKATRELGLNAPGAVPPPGIGGARRDLNVVVVFQESTYNKYLSLFGSKYDTQPMLSKYKDRMEIFPNFYSDFAGSINARFATFTGVYPVRDFNAFTVRHVPAKSIFETLNDNGYACSLFYSSYFDYTGFRDFLRGRGIAEMYDADTMPGERKAAPVSWGLQETDTLSAMRSRIKKYADDKQKFFLTYVPAAPHNPFDGTPKEFRKHEIEKIGDFTPLYLNELTYMDWVIASLVDELKTDGLLDKTIVVITGDHGEMVGEDGGPVGHGWAINPELQNVPLIIMDPERPNFRVNKTLGSQVDLMPTLLDLLGIPVPEGQLYQGGSLYSPGLPADRKIYINSYRDYGIIHNGQFTCGSRESGTGSDKPQKTYTFANENTHTTFSLEDAESSRLTITDFDRFQENLLYNYTDYCRMFGNKTDGRTGK